MPKDQLPLLIGIGAIIVTSATGTCSTNTRITDAVVSIKQQLDDGFHRTNQLLDTMDELLDETDQLLDTMDELIDGTNKRIDDLQTDIRAAGQYPAGQTDRQDLALDDNALPYRGDALVGVRSAGS